jgi:hypothetical protein
MQKVGGMMTLGLTLPIVAFGASSVKSSMEAENALTDLQAVLKSTGGVAGVTLDELTKNAAALQKLTKFSDEQVMSAQGMLLTFTKIGKDIFPAATEATLDMAEKFGMDASQAAITLGKALNDPIAGVTSLRRIGVQLTDQQEAQIKSFMAVGDIASAQKIIMQELAVEIGGVAKAAGQTTSGQFAQFMNQLDDMKETIGTALIPVLIRFMNAITPMIEAFAAAPPAVQNTIIALVALLAAAGPIISVMGTLITVIGAFGTGGALAGVGTFITATLLPALGALFTFITAVAIPAVVAFTVANAAWLIPLALVAAAVGVVWFAIKNWDTLKTTIMQLGFLIGVYLKNTFGPVITTIKQLGTIFSWVFQQIGRAIDWVVGKVNGFAQKIASIRLPSWLTPGSPTPFELGLLGISDAMGAVQRSTQAMFTKSSLPTMSPLSTVQPRMSGAANSPAGTNAGNTIINITNPKKETAEESIKRTMKSLSYMGVIPA